MLCLTGTPQQVGEAAKKFRVYFTAVDRKEDDYDYVGMLSDEGGSATCCVPYPPPLSLLLD